MTLSDHLDMVGVTLMATWAKTRKVNGDAIQSKVKNTIGPWKAGKFLPLTQRGWSLNCYALSKVWFRTKCVDLRVCNTKSFMSSCKSWLYQDIFEKPAETVLYLLQILHTDPIFYTTKSIRNIFWRKKMFLELQINLLHILPKNALIWSRKLWVTLPWTSSQCQKETGQ